MLTFDTFLSLPLSHTQTHKLLWPSGFNKQLTAMYVSWLTPSSSQHIFDSVWHKSTLKSKWVLHPFHTSQSQHIVVLCVFCVACNGSSISSVQLNVLVENYLRLCHRFHFHTHCILWAFSFSGLWVSLEWNLVFGHKKSVVWVSHG